MSALHVTVNSSDLDLLPNGLFRYDHCRYFRRSLWLLLLMMPTAAMLAWTRFGTRAWLAGGAMLGLAALITCTQLAATETVLAIRHAGRQAGRRSFA